MARDPRKNSAFDSGMRGREKPKISEAHGQTMGSEAGSNMGGEKKQGPNAIVGDPDGVTQNDSAYSSGMRGAEKAKQKASLGRREYVCRGRIEDGRGRQAGPEYDCRTSRRAQRCRARRTQRSG